MGVEVVVAGGGDGSWRTREGDGSQADDVIRYGALGADARDRLAVETAVIELHPAGAGQGTNGPIGL